MRKYIVFIMVSILMVSLAVGCSESNDETVAESSPSPNESTEVSIPNDVTYTIINEDIVAGVKRSLDIRLNHKVSEEVLSNIAMVLKNADPNTYDRTFIVYYLPDMQVGAGGWATTHFDPNLKV